MKLFSRFPYRDHKETFMFPKRSKLPRRLVRSSVIVVAVVATSAFAAGPKAYVGNFKDNTVSIIDTNAGTVVATVPVPAGPDGIVVAPNGATVFVSGGSDFVD
jgi:YVTN family beta-propeller protein